MCMLYYINIDVHKICLSRYGAISNEKRHHIEVDQRAFDHEGVVVSAV